MSAKGPHSQEEILVGEAVLSLAEGNKVFDRYTLMKVVGRSRTSLVWKAWDERVGRDVALKFLPAMSRPDASALATLKSEVKKLQEVKHPQIISIDNVENEGPLVAIVSDFVDGPSFSAIRAQKSDQVFSTAELADWLVQICQVLDHGHREGMLPHGAFKPGNILVDQRGRVSISDYGLERIINQFVARTTDIQDAGRDLLYLSPQMAAGEPVGILDDIYALGVSIYELLTSKPPFYTGDIMLQLQQKVPPPMTHRRKELRVIGEPIPRAWEETVAACLAKDPAQRPQSIEEIVSRLELKSAEAAPPPVAVPAASSPGAGAPVATVAIVVFVLVIAGFAAFMLGRKKEPVQQVVVTTNAPGLSDEAMKEFEAKRKLAEKNAAEAQRQLEEARRKAKEIADQAVREAERLKIEEAKRLAEAKRQQDELEAKLKKAGEDAAKAKAEAVKAAELAAKGQGNTQEMLELKKKLEEADAARLKMEQEAARLKTESDRKIAEAAKKAKEDADRRALEVARAQKMATDAAAEERRRQAVLDQQKREQEMLMAKIREDERKKAEEEARMKAEAAKKAAVAQAAADLAQRQFSADKKVWLNSLEMRFVPVGRVHFGATEVRVADFEAFIKATRFDAGKGWSSPGFTQQSSHPVVNVNWKDAQAFCKWLTEKEQKENLIGNRRYRLPTDAEWSEAVGLKSEPGTTPLDKDGRIKGIFPWGNAWPPVVGAGNYPDSLSYDRYEKTSPAGVFKPNAFGLFDMGGNAWEWCEDWSDSSQKTRVLRGGSYLMNLPASLFSSYRRHLNPDERSNDVGFRVVLSE